MDISLLNNKTLKIKGKGATIVVDPDEKTPKTEADAVVMFLSSASEMPSKIENARVVIKGPGEYEVGGIKVSSFKAGESNAYELFVDGVRVLIGNPDSLQTVSERVTNCHIAILPVSESMDQSVITSLEPNVALLYGEGAEETVKKLGVNVKDRASKYSVNADKIPEEFEAIILK